MWPFDTWGDNPMLPLFEGAKRTAANIPAPGEQGNYSADDFAEDYPEFYTLTDGVYTPMLPAAMLERFIESANAAVIPSRWGSDWRLAVGLYTAHLVALRMQTYADGSTPGAAASNSANVGTVKSASMGDTSISYDNAATNAGTEKWGAWNLTKYGSQLATMARMLGIAGTYVI
jgi:hypothetical protein